MHVDLHPDLADSIAAKGARDLLSACVHCGFCLETCPTYLETRDERDSPRGRIYLVRQLLETGTASATTRHHLDRCLTCRSCETTCPSGVKYAQLAELGQHLTEQAAPRPRPMRLYRWLLRETISRPRLFALLLGVGQRLRPLVPGPLRLQIPRRQQRLPVPATSRPRTMLVLEGCVQAAATPNTNDAARRVLDQLGISLQAAPRSGCCGAVQQHLGNETGALANLRHNIDAWWPHIEAGAEAIVSSASGCGAMLADYGRLLADDPAYAVKARRVSELACDLGQVLEREDLSSLRPDTGCGKVAVHTPCSLQHALREPTLVATVLRRAGFSLADTREDHLCCGSAGTYSLLQPALSDSLRRRKIRALSGDQPAIIATANIGCQLQLATAAVPVVHWIELLDPARPVSARK
ncbi:glycolate oxidase iron-sulfur subunit [Kineobactrum sediminis]|uniref:Glycolate oxidase iron-sulfur subunit n=1 Tax=Kineobactrum sediminis TaxID=1905677 RepID=A0A2N5Y2M5_9GAMM|nr:glycolate oxidase subunit GlcF [Kineobactrum sediminis]PLW82643.1 glycolate oxidase iron-sulfur subunit [Kineobactrum sediminis]